VDGCRVHRHLVRPRAQQDVDVVGGAHAAVNGQWDEDLLSNSAHDVQHGRATVCEALTSSTPSAS
jgi:hypothetical protein